MDGLVPVQWLKSTRSSGNAACVEVAEPACGQRAVRDSKELSGPALAFTAAAWSAFTTGIRAGEFD